LRRNEKREKREKRKEREKGGEEGERREGGRRGARKAPVKKLLTSVRAASPGIGPSASTRARLLIAAQLLKARLTPGLRARFLVCPALSISSLLAANRWRWTEA